MVQLSKNSVKKLVEFYILQEFLFSVCVIGIPIPENTMLPHQDTNKFIKNIKEHISGEYSEKIEGNVEDTNEDINQKDFHSKKSSSSLFPIDTKVLFVFLF